MDLLERQHPQLPINSADAFPDAAGQQATDRLRNNAQEVWRHLDAALDRVLSGNSEAFLAATTQEGGQ